MLLPEWTEKAQKRGLDPLGLQNSGVTLYQSLVPGISNVTLRIRYYGLYCWASEAYAREVGSTDPVEWRTWVRRLEALHALVAYHAGGETGVAGVEWAQKRLAKGDDPVDFEEGSSTRSDAERYLTQSMGVFGQAYLSQMMELGLFSGGANHGISLRSERGLALAGAFAASIGPELEKLMTGIIRSARVSRKELEELAPILPSFIGEGLERDLYEELLFATHDEATASDVSRRDTLRLVLLTARDESKRPKSRDVRRRLFSPAHAFPEELEPQRLRWEAYQAQDMWQVASAALLRWAISIIDQFDNGRSLPEIHGEVSLRLLDRIAGSARRTWSEFADGVDVDEVALEGRFRRTSASRTTPEDGGILAVEQVAALEKRVRDRPDLQAEIARSFQLAGGGRSIRSELLWLQDKRDRPLIEVVADLVTHRVVRRHSWVAIQKLRRQRDYTFLFEPRDGRLAYRSQYEPVPTTPRLDPAITFLSDIGLLAKTGCTPLGLNAAQRPA
jgi:hypothetical protein